MSFVFKAYGHITGHSLSFHHPLCMYLIKKEELITTPVLYLLPAYWTQLIKNI